MKLVGNQTVTVTVKRKIEEEDTEVLVALLRQDTDTFDADVFLTFLLDQGYLSYAEHGNLKRSALKIPNKEIKGEILMKLRNYFIHKYHTDHRKTGDSFEHLFSSIGKNKSSKQLCKTSKTNLNSYFLMKSCQTLANQIMLHYNRLFLMSLVHVSFKYQTEVFFCNQDRSRYISV